MKKRPFSVICDAHLRHKSGAGGTLSFLSPRNSTLIQNPQSASSSAVSHAYSTGSTISNHHPKSDSSVLSGSWGLRRNIDSISNLDEALGFYKQMARMRPVPSVVHFTQLLGRIVKMKQYLVVLSLSRDMAELGCIPLDDYTLSIVINCYCFLGRVDFGFSIFGGFFKRGILPNTATFTTLLKGLFREHKIHEAQGLFKKIIYEKLCIPNEITYGTVIDGLSKAGNTSMAIQVLRFMEKGGRCRPHTAAYNTIIDGLCKDKMMDQALSLLHEMIEKGIAPDVITYSCLVRGLCNLSKWKDVEKLLTEMKAYNIVPNVITFNILIDALCKEGQLEGAEEVLKS
ncbi:putative pentatricopeptide repeat-containing protein At1g12700, mitochondrial [Coffea eugenioides]|uniref:putative pentatricopeptide repeat-containing protein At1g12700, mitochondrial n=1 Tax=Coffea eugenioides TaxID=49369 RepID=UPI000F614A04|nr:putative pentatricopeptide repeat-containing protein At1g12700, mitochondrial [Coffea eugenioides]